MTDQTSPNGENSSKPRVSITLIQPLGVENFIFYWGIHSLSEYLTNLEVPARIETWRFRDLDSTKALLEANRDLAARCFQALKPSARRPFEIGSNPVEALSTVLAPLGEEFLDIGRRHRLFRRGTGVQRWREELAGFSRDHQRLIAERVAAVSARTPQERQIWAFSVYDRTAFWCLSVARLIKQYSPGSSVVMGGDYFIFQNARDLAAKCDWLDGAIVGYGEETLRTMVTEFDGGAKIPDLEIQGLINRAALERQEPAPGVYARPEALKIVGRPEQALQVVNVPESYSEPAETPPISYVQRGRNPNSPDSEILHVLIQRGCSFGKCTFCTQIDKFLHFSMRHEDIFADLSAKLREVVAETGPERPVWIRFDADEHPSDTFIDVLRYLDESDAVPEDRPVILTLWFQVKFMNDDLADALRRFSRKNVHVLVVMNFESLNPNSLALMKKGHSALKSIEAAKIVLDTGHELMTNYMIHFPLETEENVAQEVKYLAGCLHLVEGRINLFPYNVNSRDEIFRAADDFAIGVERFAEDVWCQEAHGFDLEYSFWGYDYTNLRKASADTWLRWAWFELVKSAGDKIRFPLRFAALASISVVTGRLSFLRRMRQIKGLLALPKRNYSKATGMFYLTPEERLERGPVRWSRLSIEKCEGGWEILRVRRGDDLSTGERIPLDDDELQVLRFLYHIRYQAEVVREFDGQIGEERLAEIIERHVGLGTLMRGGRKLVSTANDPGFWREVSLGQAEDAWAVAGESRPPRPAESTPLGGGLSSGSW